MVTWLVAEVKSTCFITHMAGKMSHTEESYSQGSYVGMRLQEMRNPHFELSQSF